MNLIRRHYPLKLLAVLLTGYGLFLFTDFSMTRQPMLLAAIPLMTLMAFSYHRYHGQFFEHSVRWIFAATIFVQSVVVAGMNISASDIYILGLFAILFITKEVQVPKTYALISLTYILYCVMSLAWSDSMRSSIAPLFQYVEFMVIGVVVFYSIGKQATIVRVLEWYVYFATGLAIITALIGLSQGYSGSSLYALGFHKNALGSILGNAIPVILGLFFYFKEKRVFYGAALLANILTLFLSGSRGSMIGAVVGVCALLFLINRLRFLFAFMAAGGVMAYIFVTYIAPEYLAAMTRFDQYSSAYSRIIIFEDVKQKIAESPLFGHGLGNYTIRIPQINFTQDDPNNVFLLNLVELGAIGLVLFAVLLLYILRSALHNKRLFRGDPQLLILSAICFAGFTSQLAHIQVDVSWLRGTGLFMFGCVGMMLALRKIKQ